MTLFFKIVNEQYIVAIGTGAGNTEITESEYNIIMSVIQNRPHADGKGYRLRTDLTWEEYDLPPEPEPEPTEEEDMREALKILGIEKGE